MRRSPLSWKHILHNAKWGNEHIVSRLLSTPLKIQWPVEVDTLATARNETASVLEQGIHGLLDLSILTSFILEGESVPAPLRGWMSANINGAYLLTGLPLSIAFQGTWRTVPMPAAKSSEQALIVYFLIGSFPSGTLSHQWPEWVDGLLDRDALDSLRDALTVAQQHSSSSTSLYLFPLMSPDQFSRLSDRSLGLPVALGARAAISGEKLFHGMIATGAIAKNGTPPAIQAVSPDSIKGKADAALAGEFSLFLCPADNLPLSEFPAAITAVPVSDFNQAWRWALLYVPGRCGREDLQRLDLVLQNATDFVTNLALLDPELVNWCSRHENKMESLLNEIRANKDRLTRLVTILEEVLRERKHELAKAIAGLITDSADVRQAAITSPTQAFLWCSHNLTLANHFGDLGKASLWATRAERYVKAAHTNVPDKAYSFRNRKFVLIRHNRYRFSTGLTETFIRDLKIAETYWQPGTVSYSVGSFYGTKAQNYAFCGPQHLKKTENCARNSQKAFGNGAQNIEARFTRGYLQQFSYLLFAYLDAGDFQKAEDAFLKSLGVSRWSDVDEQILAGSWPQYGLARFLADLPLDIDTHITAKQRKNFINGMIGRACQAISLKPEHPWQLWAYNVGRLAAGQSRQDDAEKAWQLSLACCKKIAGETVQVMKLLPLASLFRFSIFSQNEISETHQIIELIRTSQFLNKKHFQDLLDAGSEEKVLNLVAEQPEKYFPFNYR